MQNKTGFINRPAVDWAKLHLQKRVEIKPLRNSVLAWVLVGSAIGFLLLIFLGIPAGIFYGSAVRYAKEGWSSEVARGITLGSFFLLAFTALAAFILFYLWMKRKNQIKFLTCEGVLTRDGEKREWKDLQYLEYKSVRPMGRGPILLRILIKFMFADVQKIQVEMVFADKTAPAVLPPLIADQRQILELIDTIPVRRRRDGRP
jgi:hypothetical protein